MNHMQPLAKGIIYLGVKTDKFQELCKFFAETLGLKQANFEPRFATYLMPNGDKVEVYGPDDPHAANHKHFTTGPVAGFEVEDIEVARQQLEEKGFKFLGSILGTKPAGSRWAHFTGPDGNVYEIKQPGKRGPLLD